MARPVVLAGALPRFLRRHTTHGRRDLSVIATRDRHTYAVPRASATSGRTAASIAVEYLSVWFVGSPYGHPALRGVRALPFRGRSRDALAGMFERNAMTGR